MSSSDRDERVTEHYRLQRLAEGVYAALARPSGAAYSNAGIVDLGGETLVFDTGETPQSGADLAALAEAVTGRPATLVVNSHWHPDHWLGNQSLPVEAEIFATDATVRAMKPVIAHRASLADDPSQVEEMLRRDQRAVARETDERRRAERAHGVARWEHALRALRVLVPRRPTATFAGRRSFEGSRRKAELVAVGPAHTVSDVVLRLPDDGFLLTGDLVVADREPLLLSGEPRPWLGWLAETLSTPFEVVVPGHGAVSGRGAVEAVQDYLGWAIDTVERALAAGAEVESLREEPLPERFRGWSPTHAASQANLRFLYPLLAGERGR